jgi:hypothetical protein
VWIYRRVGDGLHCRHPSMLGCLSRPPLTQRTDLSSCSAPEGAGSDRC